MSARADAFLFEKYIKKLFAPRSTVRGHSSIGCCGGNSIMNDTHGLWFSIRAPIIEHAKVRVVDF